uniref:Uncharacterized protein n=1 Tax=Oryza glumipatula TaxID=40148 RepID=A0A0E0BM29_9ORYZ
MAPGSGGGGGAGGWAAGSDRDPREEKLERSMGPFAATAPGVDTAASSSSSSMYDLLANNVGLKTNSMRLKVVETLA